VRGRIRTIKPEAFLDEELWDLEVETGLPIFRGFVGLWTQADREGRFEWRPRALRAAILPYWDGDFSRVLDACATRGFVQRYTVDGREFGAVRSFTRHQAINNREDASCIPPPPDFNADAGTSTRAPRVDDACSTGEGRVPHAGQGEGKGREGKGTEPRVPSDRELRGLGMAAAMRSALTLVQFVATAYGERYRAETGKAWMASSALDRIVRGNPQTAHRQTAESLDTLAEWLAEVPEADRDATLAAVLDGAWADPWMRERSCPIARIASEPARWLPAVPVSAAPRDGDAADWHPCDGPPKAAGNRGAYDAWLAAGSPWDRTWKPRRAAGGAS